MLLNLLVSTLFQQMTIFRSKHSSAASRIQSKLCEQVRWQHSRIKQGGIDQTQLAIADAPTEPVPFSFLVMGDTDAGLRAQTRSSESSSSEFSTAFAQQLMLQLKENRFLLHTGDVTYPVGSYDNYLRGFLQPYQALLASLPKNGGYRSDDVVFTRPLLPVPGNHDYAGSKDSGLFQHLLRALCDRLRTVGIDWGHYGGAGSEAYGQTFLDDLAKRSPAQLTAHLTAHYAALCSRTNDSEALQPEGLEKGAKNPAYCLNYQPGQFTRLPNRYYRFCYGGIDFFALDSNTWNTSSDAQNFDADQLAWLEASLIASWQTPSTIGRIIYLHHSPYTTEEIRWQQSETLWVRRHLRAVLDRVAAALEKSPAQRYHKQIPLIDLTISGHAHCLEHLKTAGTDHADSEMDWLVCGGSGAGLRRQRQAGSDILEKMAHGKRSYTGIIAKSQLYAGAHGHRSKKQRFHSFVQVNVRPQQVQKIEVCPFIVSRAAGEWQTRALSPLSLGSTHAPHMSASSVKAS